MLSITVAGVPKTVAAPRAVPRAAPVQIAKAATRRILALMKHLNRRFQIMKNSKGEALVVALLEVLDVFCGCGGGG